MARTDAEVRSPFTLPANALYEETASLSSRVHAALLAAVLPIALTSAIIAGYVWLADPGPTVPRAVVDAAYGVAALTVLGGVYGYLSERERRAALPFDRPSRAELGWTLGCLPLAIGAFLLGATVAEGFGFEPGGLEYSLSDPVALAAVIFGGVLVAPLVEEVLYRGLLLGSLLGRGLSPVTAGGVTVLLFAAIHLVSLGVAGVVAIACWAVFPTLLRLKFNNLTGAWLLHALNNVYSYVVVVALGIA